MTYYHRVKLYSTFFKGPPLKKKWCGKPFPEQPTFSSDQTIGIKIIHIAKALATALWFYRIENQLKFGLSKTQTGWGHLYNRKFKSYLLYLSGSSRAGVELKQCHRTQSLSVQLCHLFLCIDCIFRHTFPRVVLNTPVVPDMNDFWCLYSWQK